MSAAEPAQEALRPKDETPATNQLPGLEGAKEITSSVEWAYRNTTDYRWLSDQTVLYAKRGYITSVNVVTKLEQRLTRLSDSISDWANLQTYHEPEHFFPGGLHFFDLSSDGEWAILGWFEDVIGTISLKGGSPRQYATLYPARHRPVWIDGSHEWLDLVFGKDNSLQEILHGSNSSAHSNPKRCSIGHGIQGTECWGYFDAKARRKGDTIQIILLDPGATDVRRPQLTLMNLGRQVSELTVSILTCPVECDLASPKPLRLSPHGDKLAWLLKRRTAENSPCVEVWVSGFDGSQMRRVVTAPTTDSTPWWDEPNALEWLPSGRGFSFIYRKALWLVAVAA